MAASGSAVTVLTPNGRRQTVKVSPNTPLLQVLEDVCKKHGFDPEDHGLKFQRSVVDLTVQWRFANLPNNAKLEMVTSSRKQGAADSQVRVALQMEDGSRLQDSFSCGQSLWELITRFPQISGPQLSREGSTPVCVYMRDEVSGEEALKKATLRSLGLTGGSAIIRFLLKKDKIDADGEAPAGAPPPHPEAPEAPPPHREAPPPHRDTIEAPPPHPEAPPPHREAPEAPPPPPERTTTAGASTGSGPRLPEPAPPAPNSQHAPGPAAPPAGGQTAARDAEEAGPSQPPASCPPPAPFVPFTGGGRRLGGPGGPGGAGGGRPLSAGSSSSLSAFVESPKAKKAKPSSSTKHKAATNPEVRDRDHSEEFLEPVEREPLVYHLDSGSRLPQDRLDQSELPDEFFEVTMDDVRKRFAQLKSERKLLEEAPLMTKALRESQMKEKMERYPKVVLRVQFPDRHVLQGFFRPLETVGAVRQFVKTHLEDPGLPFYLFVTPPKTVLDDPSATLFQADLFPGALLYFGSDAPPGAGPFVRRELLEASVSPSQADRSVASCMLGPPAPGPSSAPPQGPSSAPPQGPSSAPPQGPSSAPPQGPSSAPPQGPSAPQEPTEEQPDAQTPDKPSRTETGKIPKWLKLPGKK